jgi:hypothetical protein
MGVMQLATRKGVVASADLFENLITAWFGQRAGDPRKLPIRQAIEF